MELDFVRPRRIERRRSDSDRFFVGLSGLVSRLCRESLEALDCFARDVDLARCCEDEVLLVDLDRLKKVLSLDVDVDVDDIGEDRLFGVRSSAVLSAVWVLSAMLFVVCSSSLSGAKLEEVSTA